MACEQAPGDGGEKKIGEQREGGGLFARPRREPVCWLGVLHGFLVFSLNDFFYYMVHLEV